MPRSVLEAIKRGIFDFEPPEVEHNMFQAADAMPGSPKSSRLSPSGAAGIAFVARPGPQDVETPLRRWSECAAGPHDLCTGPSTPLRHAVPVWGYNGVRAGLGISGRYRPYQEWLPANR